MIVDWLSPAPGDWLFFTPKNLAGPGDDGLKHINSTKIRSLVISFVNIAYGSKKKKCTNRLTQLLPIYSGFSH